MEPEFIFLFTSDPVSFSPIMSEFERLQRRNQDYVLLETIKQVGASNYSLIARLTGLNPETVRYKVSKQLAKFGLDLSINVNYSELGFSMGLLTITAGGSSNGGAVAGAGGWLDGVQYLLIMGKCVGTDKYVCLYGIPYRFKKKYLETISALKQKGMIEDFESTELYWIRYPPFRSELYDFDAKSWTVDWRKIDGTAQEAGVTSFSVNRDSKVDEVDLKILRYLGEDPTSGLAKIGKEINANPRTVRYHHTEHVVKGNLMLGNRIRWVVPFREGATSQIMQLIFCFKGLGQDEIATPRKLFNKLPFTWLEAGTEDRRYYAFLDIPIAHFHDTMKYIEANSETLRNKYEMTMLDPSRTKYLSLPDHMFDKNLGWRLFGLTDDVKETPRNQP